MVLQLFILSANFRATFVFCYSRIKKTLWNTEYVELVTYISYCYFENDVATFYKLLHNITQNALWFPWQVVTKGTGYPWWWTSWLEYSAGGRLDLTSGFGREPLESQIWLVQRYKLKPLASFEPILDLTFIVLFKQDLCYSLSWVAFDFNVKYMYYKGYYYIICE